MDYKKVKKQNLLEEIKEINNKKLNFDLKYEPISEKVILERKSMVSDFLNKNIKFISREDIYILVTTISFVFLMFTLLVAALDKNINFLIFSTILITLFYFGYKGCSKYKTFTRELYKLKKEEKELEFLDVDSSGEMLTFCNSTQINKQYHKKIINSKRPFLKIEFELMKEKYLELENKLNYEKLYTEENQKEYNL